MGVGWWGGGGRWAEGRQLSCRSTTNDTNRAASDSFSLCRRTILGDTRYTGSLSLLPRSPPPSTCCLRPRGWTSRGAGTAATRGSTSRRGRATGESARGPGRHVRPRGRPTGNWEEGGRVQTHTHTHTHTHTGTRTQNDCRHRLPAPHPPPPPAHTHTLPAQRVVTLNLEMSFADVKRSSLLEHDNRGPT